MKKWITALFSIICLAAGALITYFSLAATGFIKNDDKIAVKFIADDVSKEYDGQTLYPSKYTVEGDLKEGHHAVVNLSGEQQEVGKSAINLDVKILDENNVDVSSDYAIALQSGSLEVEQRELYISINNDYLEYTDENNNNLSYSFYNSSLVEYDTLFVDFDVSLVDSNNIVSKSCFTPHIVNAKGFEVTNNYNIEFLVNSNLVYDNSSKLTEIKISPLVYSKTYDGECFSLNADEISIDKGSLVRGDTIKAINVYENGFPISDAGTYQVTLEVIIIDSYGQDVSSTYNVITKSSYNFEISPQNIDIQLPNITKEYDGISVTYSEVLRNLDNESSSKLNLNGASLSVDAVDVGTYSYTLNGVRKSSAYNSDNYSLNILPGQIVINKYYGNISAIKKIISQDYDGKAVTLTYGTNFVINNSNSYLNLSNIFEIRNIKLTKDLVIPTSEVVNIKSLEIYLNGINVTNNFEIDYSSNNFTINILPKNIVLNIIIPQGVYGEKKFIDIEDIVSPQSINRLISSHKYVFSISSVYSNSYTLEYNSNLYNTCSSLLKSIHVIDENGELVDDYYDISRSLIGLTSSNVSSYILSKDVVITLPDVKKTYDGKSYDLTTYRSLIKASGLISGDRLNISTMQFSSGNSNLNNICNAGVYSISTTSTSTPIITNSNSNSNVVTNYYNFSYINGSLTIEKQKINVVLVSISVTQSDIDAYSGIAGYVNSVYLLNYTFINGIQYSNSEVADTLEISLVPTSYEDNLSSYGITAEISSATVNNNYEIVITPGSISVIG